MRQTRESDELDLGEGGSNTERLWFRNRSRTQREKRQDYKRLEVLTVPWVMAMAVYRLEVY